MELKTKKTVNIKMLLLLFVFTGVLMFSSCDDDDDVIPVDPVAFVSLYHASPNASNLNILIDSRRINPYPFAYGDYTGYLRFFTGARNLKFSPSGANNVVIDTTVTFEDAKAYSVFVVDEFSNIDALVVEDASEAPSEGNAMLRFIHLSPDAPAVDLAIEGETEVLVDNQEFKAIPEFMEISADQYDFEVRETGNNEAILNIPDINLQAGWYYSIIVRGYETPPASGDNFLAAHVIVN